MQSYLITSKELSHKQLEQYQPSYALYRDKTNSEYDKNAQEFIKECFKFKNLKSFLHQKIDLAKELKATGVHLSSQQFDDIKYAKSLGLEVIISTHTHDEVLKAQKLGADAVVYGPVFSTPGKGAAKGIEDLKELVCKSTIKIFGLGGIIDKSNIEMIESTQAYGFASIRYFEV